MRKHYPTYAQAIGLILLQLPIGLVLILLVMPFGEISNIIISTLVNTLMLLSVIVIGLKFRKDFRFSYALFPFEMLLAAFVLIMSSSVVIDPLVNLLPAPEFLTETFSDMAKYPLLLFFAVVLAAPILEEIILRGIILDGFLKNYSPFKSILVSALLFGVMHLNFQQGIGAFLMGIVIGFLYWKTDSIILCISLHGLNNLVGFAVILLLNEAERNMSLQQYIANDSTFYALYAFSTILVLGSSWFLWTRYIKPMQALIHLEPSEASAEESTV